MGSFHGYVHTKRATNFTKYTETTPAQEITEHQVVGCQKNNLVKYVCLVLIPGVTLGTARDRT